MNRRETLAAVGSSVGVALAGCTGFRETERKEFFLEVINQWTEPVTFNLLIEQEDDVLFWDSFQVDTETESASVGQYIPDLNIDERVEGPLELRVQAEGQHTDLMLESDRIGWTSERTEAEFHIAVWMTEPGELTIRSG